MDFDMLAFFEQVYTATENEWANPFHKCVECMAFEDGVLTVMEALGVRGDYIEYRNMRDSVKYGEGV